MNQADYEDFDFEEENFEEDELSPAELPEAAASASISLDDLFHDAQLAEAAKNPRRERKVNPALKSALPPTAKKMQDAYTLPENWQRGRTLALIDKGTSTLLGNFTEYLHRTIPETRKLLREHGPVEVSGSEYVEGYLGEGLSMRLRDSGSWTETREGVADLLFPELMLGAPQVRVKAHLYLGGMVRVDLGADTQFASVSGNTLLQLPAGTNVLEQLGTDSKAAVRKAVGL